MPWNTNDGDRPDRPSTPPNPWGNPPTPLRPRPQVNRPWAGSPAAPDLDRLFDRGQDFLRGLIPGGPRGAGPRDSGPRGPGGARPGGRGLALIAIVLAVAWLGSGFYRVQPDEQGIVLRFGAFTRTTLPGLNYHLPWPIEAAVTPAVTRINRVEVGFRTENDGGQGGRLLNRVDQRQGSGSDVLAEALMLTGDENIIDINFAVFWRIRSGSEYLFNTRNPDNTVKSVVESVMREVIGRTPIQPALTQARADIEASVLSGSQAVLDQYGAGIDLLQVQLQKVDPPADVIESFRDQQRASTDADRARNEAESYRNDILPRARGDAAKITAQAEGARQASIAEATGQAQRFLSVYNAYAQAKDVTLQRLYIETMQEILKQSPSTIVDDRLKGIVPYLPIDPARAPAVAQSATPGASR